ncbi:MAG: hypothetical protein M1377_02620 [Deltaproteobacteria bacterium]|nr:hypothetical protein [Deltaproteobacteria bacterium]
MTKNTEAMEELERKRDALRAQLAATGEMRPGSLTQRYRKCGKPTCHCAAEGAPGHGPSWSLTRAVEGKTVTKVIPAGPAVERTQQQLAEYKEFREVTREFIEVSERLCDARLGTEKAEAKATAKKGGSNWPLKPRSSQRSNR